MKKLQLFLVFATLFGIRTSAQFQVNNPQPCEGDTVKVTNPYPLNNPYCIGTSEDYISTPYYKYFVYYPGNLFSVVGGTPLNTLTTEAGIRVRPFPSSYTAPATMEIRIETWKFRNDLSAIADKCGEQSIFVTPRKNVTFNGPTLLDNPGIVNYSVTNVPGVNFTWNMDPDWTIVNYPNNNSSNISVSVDPTGGGPFPLSVTASPNLNACGWPISKMITIAPCFYQGTTVFNFCEPQLNWGNILASTDFDDYPNKYPRMKGDFNGDNKDDLIAFGHSGVMVGLSTGSNFNHNTWTSALTFGNGGYNQIERPRMIGDFNGDGKDDIVGFGYSSTSVALSNGSSFSTSGFSAAPYFGYDHGFTGQHLPRFVGDFNGDGKDDVMACGHHSLSVGLSTGTAFNVSGWTGGTPFSTTTGGFGDPDKFPRMVGDFNGDGKTDMIGFGNTNVAVGLSTGSSFNVTTWTTSFTYGNDGVLQSATPRGIGDFNGDGKDDIILFGHSSVSVGISTGTSFNVSTWTTENFTDAQGWSSLTLDPLAEGAKMCIYDANGDGKDDLIGFNDGVYVAYSVGNGFQCADYGDYMAMGSYYNAAYRGDRFVGNFDNRDDEAEFVSLTTNYVGVMDCDNCTTSVANATMMRHYAVATETSGSNSVTVYKYCIEDSVSMDLSATTCEDSYFIEIKPYNLSTATAGAAVYSTGWIPQNAPQTVDFSALNLASNQLYQVTYRVGPNTSTKTLYFRITGPSAHFTNTPHQTRTASTQFGTFTIDQYCTNTTAFPINAGTSGCYDQYRYEILEVSPPLFTPALNATPVLQIPAGGGWAAGPAPIQNINMSYIVSGKVYMIKLYVRKNGVTSSYSKLVERNSCIYTPPKEFVKGLVIEDGVELSDDPASILYPNPANSDIIVSLEGYDEERISGGIYDAFGKLVRTTYLETGMENTIDLENLSPGVYMIVLQGNNRTEKLSFIKE